ncbi:protein of unknown function [Paraburkholderia sartisoli]|uniref:YfiR family protein n=1 Tax=Paraburkholderia sartisoli TaxID=83784 RepID=A0A1H4H5X7_9BURK|nr:protein of unknown function [Paraburkholderia sartisoli]
MPICVACLVLVVQTGSPSGYFASVTHSRHHDVGSYPFRAPELARVFWRQLLSFVSFCLIALLTSPDSHAQLAAQRATGQQARAVEVARIVTGIVGFTRWPTERTTIRLCIVTPARYADRLGEHVVDLQSRTIVTQRYAANDPRLETGCDVVYIEPIDEAAHEHLFQRLAGLPVLSIGGSDDACAMGSLFCLTASASASAISFAANLDAIVRSGLRINPKVLLLARTREPAQ